MNAFRDILGFAGQAADGLLTGGAISGNRRRNQFSDLLSQGQYDQAQQLALRNGEGQYAQLAQQQGAQALAKQQQEAAAAKAKQDEENAIFSGLSIALSQIADPNQRRIAFETMKPGLSQRFGFDDEDFGQVPLDDPNALRLFGQQFIDPQAQVQQQLTAQQQQEAARSNRADEGLRASGQAIDRERLALDRTGGAENFGVTPQFVRMPDGSIRAVQFSSQGRILQQDLGGTPVRFDPALEQELAAGREIGKVVGTARGDAIAGLGAQEAAVTKLNTDIDRLLTGDLAEGRRAAFGFRRPDIAVLPGEPRKDAEALVKQIAANLTIENVSKLKGPLSDKDIAFLKEASTRLSNQDISDLEAERVLTEVREFLNQNVARSRARAGVAAPTQDSDDVDSLLRKYGVQ